MERPLMRSMQHGLVAMQAEQRGGSGEIGPGLAQSRRAIAFGMCVESQVEQMLLNGQGAVEPPVGRGDFVDYAFFDAVTWGELLETFLQVFQEAWLGFRLQNNTFCQEAMADGVGGGAAFSGRSLGSP